MKQVVVTSDAHGKLALFRQVAQAHPKAAAFIDCGDSELSPKVITPFVTVNGNTDYGYDHPKYRVLTIDGIVFLVIHSHQIMRFNRDEALIKKAKQHNAQVVLFGHYHTFYNKVVNGIHLISPGSLAYNRDSSPACYALLTIENKTISVKRINVNKIPAN